MSRIERPAIRACVARIAAIFEKFFITVVASLTQALQWTKPEFVDVAAMRLDVIGDGGRGDDASLQADRAERFSPELMAS